MCRPTWPSESSVVSGLRTTDEPVLVPLFTSCLQEVFSETPEARGHKHRRGLRAPTLSCLLAQPPAKQANSAFIPKVALTGYFYSSGGNSEPKVRVEQTVVPKRSGTKKAAGREKGCHPWKGNLPPFRPAPAACAYIIPQKVTYVSRRSARVV